jgi:hypothetical protein
MTAKSMTAKSEFYSGNDSCTVIAQTLSSDKDIVKYKFSTTSASLIKFSAGC